MPTKPTPPAKAPTPKSGNASKIKPAGRVTDRVEKGEEVKPATVYAADQRAEVQGGETAEPIPFKLQLRDTCPYCSSPMPPIERSRANEPRPSSVSPDSQWISLALPRPALEQILGTMMSQISKRCYDSRWITGTEATVPHLAEIAVKTDVSQRWGKDGVTVGEAKVVLALRDALGYVVTERSQTEEGYIPYRPANREKGQANGEI